MARWQGRLSGFSLHQVFATCSPDSASDSVSELLPFCVLSSSEFLGNVLKGVVYVHEFFIVIAKTYRQSLVLTCFIFDNDWSVCWNTGVDQWPLQIEVIKMFMPGKCNALKSICLLPCWHVRELPVSLLTAVSAGFLISKLLWLFLRLPVPCKTKWHFNLPWSS